MAASWILYALYGFLLSQSVSVPSKATTAASVDSDVYVDIRTAYGDLRGVRKITATKVSVDSFLGIPFAQPPVGQRRFSKPEPPTPWTGLRDATKFRYECLQRFSDGSGFVVGDKPVEQSEDCLYLNVYVPADDEANKNQPLAVMVWIHGGSYYLGAGSHYDGTELAATGVIVVTINYRLDIFGFLSNEDDSMPGNYGMLDQIMALKFVKENIRYFAGDPNRVTVFGESSGSTSVSLLILSPLASGLFQRAIMESGVSLSPWASTTPANKMRPRATLSMIGGEIGCTDYDITKKLQCLRSVDARALFNASDSVENFFYSRMLFTPRVENTFSVLPDLPINLLTNNNFNHVDTMRGFNTDESGGSVDDKEDDGITRNEFVNMLKYFLEPYIFTDRDALINEIIANYTENETDPKAIRYAAVRAASDFDIIASTVVEANIQSTLATGNKHYLYEFQHRPSFSTKPSWLNATHMDEVAFVFGVNLPVFRKMSNKVPNAGDILVWNQMKTLWSNFAKYGNPTQSIPAGAVHWKTYNVKNGSMYLKIDTQSEILAYDNAKGTSMFRDNILKELQTGYSFDSVVG